MIDFINLNKLKGETKMNISKSEGLESVIDYINRVDVLETNIKGLIADMGDTKDIMYGTDEYEFLQNLNGAINWLGYVRRALRYAKAMMED